MAWKNVEYKIALNNHSQVERVGKEAEELIVEMFSKYYLSDEGEEWDSENAKSEIGAYLSNKGYTIKEIIYRLIITFNNINLANKKIIYTAEIVGETPHHQIVNNFNHQEFEMKLISGKGKKQENILGRKILSRLIEEDKPKFQVVPL